MADLTAAAPIETEKDADVHGRSDRPWIPVDRQGQMRMLVILLVWTLCAAALVALAFQARASWTEARDWVVPMTIPFYAIGGIAMTYLFLRGAWLAASAGLTFLFIIVALTGFDLWRAALTTGPDGLRDSFSITIGVLLGVTVACFLGAMAWVEIRRPERPPAPDG